MINELRIICQKDRLQYFVYLVPGLSEYLLNTAFQIVCYNGCLTILKYLVKNHTISKMSYQIGFGHIAKTNQVNLLNYIFEEKIAYNQEEIVKSLIHKYPSFMQRENFKDFNVAYSNKNYEIICFFVMNGLVTHSDIENILQENYSYNSEILRLFKIKALDKNFNKNFLQAMSKTIYKNFNLSFV